MKWTCVDKKIIDKMGKFYFNLFIIPLKILFSKIYQSFLNNFYKIKFNEKLLKDAFLRRKLYKIYCICFSKILSSELLLLLLFLLHYSRTRKREQ